MADNRLNAIDRLRVYVCLALNGLLTPQQLAKRAEMISKARPDDAAVRPACDAIREAADELASERITPQIFLARAKEAAAEALPGDTDFLPDAW